jgi:uncharacterized protein YecE (DUF72 family)
MTLGAMMQFWVGTSGYSYKEWMGSFYPDKIPQKGMLSYYSRRLTTVEINNSFYRLPTPAVVESWAEQTPPNFRFVLKAPREITHFNQLRECESLVDQLLDAATVLKARRGPILFQLPPYCKKDITRLDAFLDMVGTRTEIAFEFRHESWFDAAVYDCLRGRGCALCVADAEDLPPVELIQTTDWGYLRLRRQHYTDQQLRTWVETLREQSWHDTYVFFKHEDSGTGPQLATQFLELADTLP